MDNDDENQVWQREGEDAETALAEALAYKEPHLPIAPQRALPRWSQSRSWDAFFSRHQANFFKDRHYWAKHEWLSKALSKGGIRICELGCGAGNAILPLLEENPYSILEYNGVDTSQTAVKLLQEKIQEKRVLGLLPSTCVVKLGVGDVAGEVDMPTNHFDVVFLIFVLSAIQPTQMSRVVQNAFARLRPGGRVLIRDYAWGDVAQQRFPSSQRLSRGLYVRTDGTLSFFFTPNGLQRLFMDAGFAVELCKPICRRIKNRSSGVAMDRVWLDAEFIKC